MTSIGKRLRSERKRLKKTLPEFSIMGGMTKNTEGNYEKEPGESGYSSPSLDYLIKLGEAGVDVHYIIFGTYRPEIVKQEIDELIVLLMQMPDAHRAISFSILTMFQETASAGSLEKAAELWRAVRLFGQFFKLDKAGRELVEFTVESILKPGAAGA